MKNVLLIKGIHTKSSQLLLFVVLLLCLLLGGTSRAQWESTGGPGPGAAVKCFVVNGNNVFTGTWGGPSGYSGGVYLSTNEGTNWIPHNTGLADTAVLALNIIGEKLFAGTLTGGVYISSNNGENWVSASNGLTNINVVSFAVLDTDLFCGTYGGVFHSTDSGTSWIEVNNGLPIASPLIVSALATIGTNLFAGTDAYGVFFSADNGSNWTEVNNGLTNTRVTSLAAIGNNLFAGTFSGVFLSTDNGTTWINTQGLAGVIVNALITIGPNIFAGSDGGGIFLSTDNGSIWTSVGLGMPNTTIYAFASNGLKIFAGTLSGIVYRRNLSEIITSLENNQTDLPGDFTISQNYPNPFNPSTIIKFQVPNSSFVNLIVYDVLGNEVATLVNEEKPTGSYEVNFKAANLSSGVYLYKLQAGDFIQTKKMILMK